MEIINLCAKEGCCPAVKITDNLVEIGEKGNLCRLKINEWNSLKEKIINRKI